MLGANDGTVSVASVVVGVAASGAPASAVLVAGVAATVAGAVSMAAGEYVSVRSQADLEAADLEMERRELERDPEGELAELAGIYESRGLPTDLALRVAEALHKHDALAAHAREELGISEQLAARPFQAAIASAAAFAVGALPPLVAAIVSPRPLVGVLVTATTLLVLTVLGGTAARLGGASIPRGAIRVLLWGSGAMALTAAVGHLLGVSGLT